MSQTQHLIRLAAFLILGSVMLWLLSTTPAKAQHQLTACSPLPTPEALNVKPVKSPTRQLTQTLTVALGNGRIITASSEGGITSVSGVFSSLLPVPVIINLAPRSTNHVVVTGLVEYAPQCFYTLSRTVDENGAPLTIVQEPYKVFLPLILRN